MGHHDQPQDFGILLNTIHNGPHRELTFTNLQRVHNQRFVADLLELRPGQSTNSVQKFLHPTVDMLSSIFINYLYV